MSDWALVYEKAIRDDGTLLFPERLTHEFLLQAQKTMGSYMFANQYQNEIIPSGKQTFRKNWNRYFGGLPDKYLTFAFVDPAISEENEADYTAIVVVSTDILQNWYVRYAERFRCNPTETINRLFELHAKFQCQSIGIEDVAFQKSLVHFTVEEMKRRKTIIPVTGIKRGTDQTKEQRILSLVPRYEWGTLLMNQGLHDLELELAQFPRGSHDDILDALSSIALIASYPTERKRNVEPTPQDPGYEAWFIKKLIAQSQSNHGE